MTPDDYECRKCHASMFVPDGMDPLEPDVRFCSDCMVVELERLQAVINRLPKWRDGKPAIPGDEGVARHGSGWKRVWVQTVLIAQDVDGIPVQVGYCYSSDEAAQKARLP